MTWHNNPDASRRALIAAQQARREQRLSRIEDYLFIGGPRLLNREAAERLGVCRRTIQRYRAHLGIGGRP